MKSTNRPEVMYGKFYMLKVTNMAIMRIFEVSGKFIVAEIYTKRSYELNRPIYLINKTVLTACND
jgi:hypothetical protein